jgi:repressor LexA
MDRPSEKASRPRGRQPTREITPAQERVLQTIREFLETHDYPPSLPELAELLGIKVPSVHDFLKQLERKGYIRRRAKRARSLELTDKRVRAIGGLVSVPIIGEVPAGSPLMAEENFIGELLVDEHMVRSGTYFALRVEGDSMIEAGIQPDDYVVIRQQPLAENGDIVVALLNGDATLKRLKIRDNEMYLKPENQAYPPIPIQPDDDLRIVGKLVAVRRKLEPEKEEPE